MLDARRTVMEQIFQAGLAAVAPDGALLRHLTLAGDVLHVDDRAYPLRGHCITVLGAGKGAAPMASAVENLLGAYIAEGLVVVKYDHGLPLSCIALAEAGHPVPDSAGIEATQRLLALAAGAEHIALCLFTGGASALTPAPVAGITLEDLQRLTKSLLDCGATIQQLNALRKHVSCFSGGQLARQCRPATIINLIVSDVVGDALDVIASGPTAPDPSTFADCWEIITRFGLEDTLPPAVRTHLQRGLAGSVPETPKADDALFAHVQNVLVATNSQALEAAAAKASSLGYTPRILTDRMVGEAREQADMLIHEAQRLAHSAETERGPVCLLAGGETTVTLRRQGKGGRNQEMALAAALALHNMPHVAALFAGTDGTDGPTDAAGGFAFADSAQRIQAHGSPQEYLDAHESYAALSASGDIYITGPTRTNVMDMAIVLVHHA